MLGSLVRRGSETRAASISINDVLEQLAAERFVLGGHQYGVPYADSPSARELTALRGQANSVVGTCISIRAGCFSEVRFAWQPFEGTRAGFPFGTPALRLLEEPWPGGTTGDLLVRMEVDLSLHGNSYWVADEINRGELLRLDPNHVTVLTELVAQPESSGPVARRLFGYMVVDADGQDVKFYDPTDVAHYKSKLSAETAYPFTGVSWLSEILPDVTVDYHMTKFKQGFLHRGAIPGLVVIYPDGVSKEQIDVVREVVESRHEGTSNAFKTLHLGGGADVKTVGLNMAELEMKALQGASETRIAAAAGVPPVVASFSEGLQGSQLNAGNYVAARRRFADITMRPLWRAACGALEKLVRPHPTPRDQVRLWYEERDVAFLQEDVKDAAEIRARDAAAMRQLSDGGWEPDSVVEAISTGDYKKLVHSGLPSVQVQPGPTSQGPTPDDDNADD